MRLTCTSIVQHTFSTCNFGPDCEEADRLGVVKRELTELHIFLLTTIVPVYRFMHLNSLLDTSKETSQAMKCQLKKKPEAPSCGGFLQFLVSAVAKVETGSTLQ